MEVNVNVKVELGEKSLAVLTALVGGQKTKVETKDQAPAKSEDDEAEKPAPKASRKAAEPKDDEAPKTRRSRASKKEDEVAFEDLDEDAQLEAIRALVTRHTKKGKSKDIKEILGSFDAGRAGDLSVDDYADAYDVFKRYDAGESLDDLLA